MAGGLCRRAGSGCKHLGAGSCTCCSLPMLINVSSQTLKLPRKAFAISSASVALPIFRFPVGQLIGLRVLTWPCSSCQHAHSLTSPLALYSWTSVRFWWVGESLHVLHQNRRKTGFSAQFQKPEASKVVSGVGCRTPCWTVLIC